MEKATQNTKKETWQKSGNAETISKSLMHSGLKWVYSIETSRVI